MPNYKHIAVREDTRDTLRDKMKKCETWDTFLLSLLHGNKSSPLRSFPPVAEKRGKSVDSLLLDFEEFSNEYIRKNPASLNDMKAVKSWLEGKI